MASYYVKIPTNLRSGSVASEIPGALEKLVCHHSASLGREPEADLSTGPDGKRMESHVQLVRGVEGAYMIGAIQFTQPTSPSRPAAASMPEGSVFSMLGIP